MPQHKLFTLALFLGASLMSASGRAQPASGGWDAPATSRPVQAPANALLPRERENPPVIASTRPLNETALKPQQPSGDAGVGRMPAVPPPAWPRDVSTVDLPSPPPRPSGPIQSVSYVEDGWIDHDAPAKGKPNGAVFMPALASPATSGLLSLERTSTTVGSALVVGVTGPETVSPGQPAVYQIVVRNGGKTPLGGVRLEQPAPEGVRVGATDPPAVLEPNRLVWNLGTLEPQTEYLIKLELIPGTAPEWTLEPRAVFTGWTGLKTRVQQPSLTAIQVGPAQAVRGSKVVIRIQVTNNTGTPIHRVMVRDHLPKGLQHPQGDQIEAELGTMTPGETRYLPLEVETTQTGRLVNELMVWSQEGQVVRSRWSLQINEPGVQQLTGPAGPEGIGKER